MSATFSKYVQTIINQAGDEAQKEGADSIEAQHLLLAIAAEPEAATQLVLSAAGLDYQALRIALQHEFEQSLGVVRVSLDAFPLIRLGASHSRPTQLGASARLALERGFASGDRRSDLRRLHLVFGILQAQKGTVPRALALAGINQAELMAHVLEALTDNSE